MAARWYVVHVYSGSEKKVAESLREQAVLKNMEDKILEVLVPAEKVFDAGKAAKLKASESKKKNAGETDVKDKAFTERKFFPGYVLVKMEMSDDCWMVIKNTPRVTGFLGSRNKPMPISDAEVERIIRQVEEGVERPKTIVKFEIGEQVRVCDGPFASFIGLVEDVDDEKSRLKLSVSIFGRSTPVELEFNQVEKV